MQYCGRRKVSAKRLSINKLKKLNKSKDNIRDRNRQEEVIKNIKKN